MWMRGDAIRSSPTDRMWLSVKPPCVILWQGERIEVLFRKVIQGDKGRSLRFECRTPRGREFFIIHPGGLHQPPRCEWLNDGESRIEDGK